MDLAHLGPWVLSVTTFVCMLALKRSYPYGWHLQAANQLLWIGWSLLTQYYGFLPLQIAITAIALQGLLHRKPTTHPHSTGEMHHEP